MWRLFGLFVPVIWLVSLIASRLLLRPLLLFIRLHLELLDWACLHIGCTQWICPCLFHQSLGLLFDAQVRLLGNLFGCGRRLHKLFFVLLDTSLDLALLRKFNVFLYLLFLKLDLEVFDLLVFPRYWRALLFFLRVLFRDLLVLVELHDVLRWLDDLTGVRLCDGGLTLEHLLSCRRRQERRHLSIAELLHRMCWQRQ